MNIVLAEERAGKQLAEKSFEKEVVLVGRDPSECDFAFEKDSYPMVSRRHAEVRWHDNKWWINDLGSSYGTFLNERPVSSPQALSFGDALRFGTDGPTVRVVWFEMAEGSAPEIVVEKAVENVKVVEKTKVAEPPAPSRSSNNAAPFALLESGENGSTILLSGQGGWIGREPGCEVLVESSPLVSRRHAYIRFENGVSILSDNGSFNGTFLNDQRITQPVKLAPGDRITLGTGGPVFIYRDPTTQRPAPVMQTAVGQPPAREPEPAIDPKTMVAKFSKRVGPASQLEVVSTTSFGSRSELSIGRADGNDIHLDSLQVSKLHAKFVRSGNDFLITDTGSANGVFVNGERITKHAVKPADDITIASFSLRLDSAGNVTVFDQRSKTRIDAIELFGKVGKAILVDGISLSIGPNEFVGIIGPSGAGKSTLIELLNGVRSPKGGKVVMNGHDLDRNLNALRQSIGYVPQDDIVHRELSVERTLMYVAKLRLPRDVSSKETASIVDEVLNLTGLRDRRKTPVNRLSGGERKRISIAVELITRPSVIYLDEPTSGLDPLTAEKMMSLFRELTDSGRTVVMTTHSTNDIGQFDKVAMLAAGKLVYFGPPADAPKYFGVPDFKSIFESIDSGHDSGGLKQKFAQSPQYKQYVAEPLQQVANIASGSRPKKTRLGIFGSIGQFFILSRRYFEVFRKDKLNLLILLAQAPIIAFLTYFAVGATQSRDFVYFVLALVAIWFGTSVSAREIVRERPIYKRERMYNLGIMPYVASKLFVIGFIVALQCLLLFVPLKLLHFLGLMSVPGEYAGIPHLWTMLLTAGVGVSLGLLVSALVRTNELATTLVPLILIPQILFCGIIGVPSGLSKVASLAAPGAWSFDTMKRFSTLDTLEPEGADPRGKTKGLGLYQYIQTENDRLAEDARKSIEEYKKSGTFYGGDGTGVPDMDRIEKIPNDLSGYVTFLHPWMGDVVNQVVLMLMFGILTVLSLIVLRLGDIR